MSGKDLALVIACLVSGILFGRFTGLPVWAALCPAAAALMVFVISVIISRRNPFRVTVLHNEAAAGLMFLAIGFFSSCMGKADVDFLPSGSYSFSGKVEDYISKTYGDRLLVDVSHLSGVSIPMREVRNIKMLVTIPDATDVNYGDVISGKGEFLRYDAPSNYLKTDYENFLRSKNIFLIGNLEPESYRLYKSGGSLTSAFRKMRDRIETRIELTGLDRQTKAFLMAIILGDKSAVSSEDRMTFADAGVSHIFAVSGFHVSMIAMFILGILSLCLFGEMRKWKFLLALPFIWFYILLVGASPSTLRAGIMLTVGFAALFLQRKNSPVKALAWAVILILSFNASALFDIGFQLSVICVASILLIARPLNFMEQRRHHFLHGLISVLLVTLTATFSTWLICAFYFHRFSLMFLPLNLLAVPLMPFFVALSILYLAIESTGLAALPLQNLLDGCVAFFHHGASYLTSLSPAVTDLYPRLVAVMLWLAGVVVIGWLLAKNSAYQAAHQGRGWSARKWAGLLPVPVLLLAFSIGCVMFYPAEGPEGFILQRNNMEASIMHYHDNSETQLSVPEENSSIIDISGRRIMTLRNGNVSDVLWEAGGRIDILLLCKGCKELSQEILDRLGSETLLVTHPSLHWRHERAILSRAAEAGLRVHSLRYDGPLHVFD